jgi:hypothetical protein
MATVNGTIKAIALDEEPFDGGNAFRCLVSATFPAYTSSTDTAQIGGFATPQLWGAASDTLQTLIQKCRRDGKTVTIRRAMRAQPGSQAGVKAFFGGAVTITGGNITALLMSEAEVDTTFAAGVTDIPVRVAVEYSLS